MIVWYTCIAFFFLFFCFLSLSCLLIAKCSLSWVPLFFVYLDFFSRCKFFRSAICFSRVSFSSSIFFVFILFSLYMFESLICYIFSLLISSISILISLSLFFLSFSSCSFGFRMIFCSFIFDFISTSSFTNIFPVSFSFCSCIFKSFIFWSLSHAWFISVLLQLTNVLSTASNILLYWLIFVISFSFCCFFCLSSCFWSFKWSNCIFISSFFYIIL